MGWSNPAIPWRELEGKMSWGRHGELKPIKPVPVPMPAPPVADEPAESSYVELHAHSHFSFLDGVSSPAEMCAEAVRLGLRGLALVDHDGFYGAQQFAQAAAGTGLMTVFGAELSLDLPAPQNGVADPVGQHLLVLAKKTEDGYPRLAEAIGEAQLAGGEKGKPSYDLDDLADKSEDNWMILTGCRKGAVRQALERHGFNDDGFDAAVVEIRRLVERFGADNVVVELTDQALPTDDARNMILSKAADLTGVLKVATTNAHYARPADHAVANALAALRARRSLDEMRGWLATAPTAHLRSEAEMRARFDRWFPGAVKNTLQVAQECHFNYETIQPELPDCEVGPGYTEMSWLRKKVEVGARIRYGSKRRNPRAYEQLEKELAVIENRGFAGYFLIVNDIVEYCRERNILAQGRGSAANSAVCFALGITNVDPVEHNLVFERFLSPVREGYPDIDVDIEAKLREDVIQHVYDKYGRDRAAQVANVICYRPKLALRDAARALGYSVGAADAWSAQVGPHEGLPETADPAERDEKEAAVEKADAVDPERPPDPVIALAKRLERMPRHLGIHSGGMVIVDRPIAQVVPTEWARMAGRTVLQWDKEDCADARLVKFDLLGLGMLGALHDTFDLVEAHFGRSYGLGKMPQNELAVYEMIQEADTVGVFQIESRAQMATLPRLKPENFYDLVVEVSLIRPGPIQGGAVHPYLRRRRKDEAPDPPDPILTEVLERTMGVVLFQEQCLQIAIVAGGLSAAEADQLRRAISSKRSSERIAELRSRLMEGMKKKGISDDVAADIYTKLEAFSGYGFPESHSISMAYLVWCSAYLKRYYPAAFTAALLNNQPMGFYSSASLVADAQRHDVTVRRIDVNISEAKATLENPTRKERHAYRPTHKFASHIPQPAIRLGLSSVRSLGDDAAESVVVERDENGLFKDLEDFSRRTALSTAALEALATAGAFACFGLSRREALWAVGAVAGTTPDHLPATTGGASPPPLPAMTPVEETFADLWATSVSPENHPIHHVRDRLETAGVTPAGALADLDHGKFVHVAGLVTHRQRPPTAGGVTFLSLEDETGMANVICPAKLWERQRRTALAHSALIVHGTLECDQGATNILAGRFEPLRIDAPVRSRNFR